MKHLNLDSKRPFNTRAYLILVALLAPAELAILPYALSLSAAEPPGLQDLLLGAAIVFRTILMNGTGGLMFGWLYWSFGLESAMLAHISADVIVHGFVPLIGQLPEHFSAEIAETRR